jgi:hypothetical protein
LRNIDDTLGGGRVVSMKPFYMPSNQLSITNPYKALYYLPQNYGYENAVMTDNESLKEHIEIAVKHFIMSERERIKNEIVDDAIKDIRHEMHYMYLGDRQEARENFDHKQSLADKSFQTNRDVLGTPHAKSSKSARVKEESVKKTEKVNTSHHHGKHRSKDKSILKTSKHHHGRIRSKSKDTPSKKSSIITNNSKKSYEFNFDSEEERKQSSTKKPTKSKTFTTEVVEVVDKTPSKKLSNPNRQENFTFSKRESENAEEIANLKENMKNMETNILSMLRTLKVDLDTQVKYTDDKFRMLESSPRKVEIANSELEYIKGVNEALEEERK